MKLPLSLIESVSTRNDGTIKIVLGCQEMPVSLMAELFILKQNGSLVRFETDKEAEPKSKSQRLKAVLFKLWEAEGKQGEFENFYAIWMEKIINTIKDKI